MLMLQCFDTVVRATGGHLVKKLLLQQFLMFSFRGLWEPTITWSNLRKNRPVKRKLKVADESSAAA